MAGWVGPEMMVILPNELWLLQICRAHFRGREFVKAPAMAPQNSWLLSTQRSPCLVISLFLLVFFGPRCYASLLHTLSIGNCNGYYWIVLCKAVCWRYQPSSFHVVHAGSTPPSVHL